MKEAAEKVRHGKRITKGDKVYVISGNSRGQVGKVLSHMGDKVLVQGINIRKKTVKKSQDRQKGAIIEREMPIHISNVKLWVSDEGARSLKVKTDGQGERQLYYKDGKNEVVYRPVKKRKMQ